MTIVSVKLTKKEQVEQRRALVLELSSQGMSQQQIVDVLKPDVLKISQKTVSRDLEYLKANRIEYVKKNRQHMTEEYQATCTNFRTLRRDAFTYYRKAKENNDVELIMKLIPIIESIEANIHSIVAAGDMIEAELIKFGKEQNQELEDKMERALAKTVF